MALIFLKVEFLGDLFYSTYKIKKGCPGRTAPININYLLD